MTGGAANKETNIVSISHQIWLEEQLIRKQNIVPISSSDMTGGAANKETNIVSISTSDMTGGEANNETNIVSISSSDMTGGAANKETKYSLNIPIRYDWRSS